MEKINYSELKEVWSLAVNLEKSIELLVKNLDDEETVKLLRNGMPGILGDLNKEFKTVMKHIDSKLEKVIV